MADDREHRIRTRAHSIWEREGRPHGRDQDHWHQASREEDAPGAASDPVPNPGARSLGSAAQSDLIPEDAAGSAERPGSLVDTGPALGLVAGSPGAGGTGGGSAGLGNLSLGQDTGTDLADDLGPNAAAGGMSSIGTGVEPDVAPGDGSDASAAMAAGTGLGVGPGLGGRGTTGAAPGGSAARKG